MRKDNQYIRTYTGVKFYPLHPEPDEINIEDIAHALSNNCRWGGHCRYFYPVAQHSVFVTRLLSEHRLCGLLHDAAEAYLMDMPSPIKRQMPEYTAIEDNLMEVVARKFGFEWPKSASVTGADRVALYCERKVLFPKISPEGCLTQTALDFMSLEDMENFCYRIKPVLPDNAETLFLEMFERLQREPIYQIEYAKAWNQGCLHRRSVSGF